VSARYPLLGTDTAWRRFDANRGISHSLFDRQLRALELAALALNLTPESVHLASEVAGLEPILQPDERLALIVLILVSLAALREGSTRFPVIGLFGGEPMRRMLDGLCNSAIGDLRPAAMAASIESLLQSGSASAVVGSRPGVYKPLLFIAPYISHQRIYRAEGELAGRLARMLNAVPSKRATAEQVSSALAEVLARPMVVQGNAIALSAEQRAADGRRWSRILGEGLRCARVALRRAVGSTR
jgi:hypothetical protein